MSWICLLGPSPRGVRAIAALGYGAVVLVPPGAEVPSTVTSSADQIVVTDIACPKAVRAAIDVVAADRGMPSLVVSFTEPAQLAAAVAATELGLPTVSPEAVTATRNKHLAREALAPTPWAWPFFSGSAETVYAWLATQPAGMWVVKPDDGTGSENVHVVSTPPPAGPPPFGPGRWIAERMAYGPEFSVEAVTREGRHELLGITAKSTTGAPGFVENGQVVPATVDEDDAAALWAATRAVLDAVGIRFGASHTELRLDPEHGAVLMETHTRPGGDCIPELVELTTGRDQYRLALAALLGVPETHTAPVTPAAAIRFLLPNRPGRLMGVSAGHGATDPAIHRFAVDLPIGAEVGAVRSSDDRVGYVIAVADRPATAEAAASLCANTTHLRIRPAGES